MYFQRLKNQIVFPGSAIFDSSMYLAQIKVNCFQNIVQATIMQNDNLQTRIYLNFVLGDIQNVFFQFF